MLKQNFGLLTPLLLLGACAPDGDTSDDTDTDTDGGSGVDSDSAAPVEPLSDTVISLLPAGQANLLVPIQLGLDPVGRRLFVSSNGLPNLAEIDLDAAALVTVHEVPDMTELHPFVAADEDGSVWLGFRGLPALARFDPASGSFTAEDVPVSEVHALAAVAGGGAVAAGEDQDGDGDLLLAIATGKTPTSLDYSGGVLGLDAATAGGVNALVRETIDKAPNAMVTLNGATLEETARCDINPASGATAGFSWFDELAGGGFAISQDRSISVLACDDGDWSSLKIGSENRSVFGLDDGSFVALDRMGGQDKNWGLARYFDGALQPTRTSVQVGKNSGYGARDPQTGLVWMNSEGTGEVWAWQPETGVVEHRVRLGAHVESLVMDPSNDRRVFFTGRLSSSFGWANLETGETLIASDVLIWPVSPTWLDGRLYVLDELVGTIAELDPDTLTVLRSFDAGLGPNPTLTLSDLAADADRGWLYVNNGGTGRVAAIDAEAGSVLNSWGLFDATVDGDTPGRTELLVAGDGLVALRNSDGALRRVNPSSGAVTSAQADSRAVHFVIRGHAMDTLALSADGARVWSGPWAFDPVSLESVLLLDADVQVLADEGEYGLIAWSAEPAEVVHLDAAGAPLASFATAAAPWGFPGMVVRGPEGDRGVVLGSYDRGDLQYVGASGD